MVVKYLFNDIFSLSFYRFFSKDMLLNNQLLYDFAFGLKPRKFHVQEDQFNEDRIIYEEYQQVSEFYFVLEGKVGIGFNLTPLTVLKPSFTIS